MADVAIDLYLPGNTSTGWAHHDEHGRVPDQLRFGDGQLFRSGHAARCRHHAEPTRRDSSRRSIRATICIQTMPDIRRWPRLWISPCSRPGRCRAAPREVGNRRKRAYAAVASGATVAFLPRASYFAWDQVGQDRPTPLPFAALNLINAQGSRSAFRPGALTACAGLTANARGSGRSNRIPCR